MRRKQSSLFSLFHLCILSNVHARNSAGGLVSTISDLSAYAHGILSRSDNILPSEAAIRAWLKPDSVTGSLHSLVGFPWEIFRTANLTPAHPKVIDIYAKGGGAYNYRSQFALLDDYGVAVVVLTAGSSRAVTPIYDHLLTALVPALDDAAREQAEARYAGEFVGDDSGVVVNATLVLDEDSILITSLARNGSDILAGFQQIFSTAFGEIVGLEVDIPRLYPIDVEAPGELEVDGETRAVVYEDWRLTWSDFASVESSDLADSGLSTQDCLSWTLVDWIHYGKEPLDRFVFVKDAETNEVLGFEVPFLRSGLLRVAASGEEY